MTTPYMWPPEKSHKISLLGTPIAIESQIFGALSQDPNSPFSRISIANSSFSLDPYKGCPLNCAYCVVAGAARDIELKEHLPGKLSASFITKPVRLFSGKALSQALVTHSAFLKDKSVVSIGTGSTDAFLEDVENETWEILKTLLEMGYTNPIWIVTKYGVSDKLINKWVDRFKMVIDGGIKIAISVTYSNMPSQIEPYRGNRFRNIDRLRDVGVKFSHHLRPIIPGVNDSDESIEKAIDASIGLVDNICIGGLRRDPGVDLAWHYINGLDLSILPETDRKKTLPEGLVERVQYSVNVKGYSIPVFTRSSEALAQLLNIPEFNLYKYRSDDENCLLLTPAVLKSWVFSQYGNNILCIVRNIADDIGLGYLEIYENDEKIILGQAISYQEHRALIHAIGHILSLP